MRIVCKVVDFFNVSIGPIVGLKLPDKNTFLHGGMILSKTDTSRWTVIGGIRFGKKQDINNPNDDDYLLIKDYRIKHLSGEERLYAGDEVYVDDET